jgi:hypothetical protein
MQKLVDLERKGETVDIPVVEGAQEMWSHPMVIGLMAAVGVSVLVNVILLVVLSSR